MKKHSPPSKVQTAMQLNIARVHLHEKWDNKVWWHGAEIQVVIEGSCQIGQVTVDFSLRMLKAGKHLCEDLRCHPHPPSTAGEEDGFQGLMLRDEAERYDELLNMGKMKPDCDISIEDSLRYVTRFGIVSCVGFRGDLQAYKVVEYSQIGANDRVTIKHMMH
ncbi:hypothetical protein DVH24_041977 [Malus domestica]|uniref:Uncharacterized protein n=1 Tax=Malus domestica TaxID=3750 RepID=A0A498IPV0_MALDO|nr:hypothetical protein DVH24_041977 [Malus domestica]